MTCGRQTRRAAVLAVVVALSLVGCSAGGEVAPTPSSALTSAPGGGVSLRQMGISNGPAGFALPAGLRVLRAIDQPNVVTLVVERGEARRTLDYLRLHGASMGLADVKTGNGSMTFTLNGWEGGFTTSTDIAGVTLRRLQ